MRMWRELLQEILLGMRSSCVLCVCERKTSSSNGEKKQAILIWKKCDLYSTSPHIFLIYIFTPFVQWIYLVCNLSGPEIASRLCHKYIIHSAIWSLCTRVSLLYVSHRCATLLVQTRNKILNLKKKGKNEEQFRLSQTHSHLLSRADERK